MLFNLNYINPTAINIGPLSIKWYGIIIAVGILIGYFIAQESLKSIGLHKDTLVDIIFYCAIFGFLVASSWWTGIKNISRKHAYSRIYYSKYVY